VNDSVFRRPASGAGRHRRWSSTQVLDQRGKRETASFRQRVEQARDVLVHHRVDRSRMRGAAASRAPG